MRFEDLPNKTLSIGRELGQHDLIFNYSYAVQSGASSVTETDGGKAMPTDRSLGQCITAGAF